MLWIVRAFRVAAVALPGVLCAEPGFADEPVPTTAAAEPDSDVHPPASARTNTLIVGAATTVGFYGMAVGTSYLWPSSPVSGDLRIPVAGPYMALFGAGCGDTELGCGTFTAVLRTLFAGLSAVGQTGGVLMLAEAAFMRTNSSASGTQVRGGASRFELELSGDVAASEPAATLLYAVPMIDEHSFGFALGGVF